MLPLYLECLSLPELNQRSEALLEMLEECALCPNECRAKRLKHETSMCNAGKILRVSSYGAHYGEEPPLVGSFGSGTIFLTHCNLKFVYCQNYEISHLGEGFETTPEEMAKIMLSLQEKGCHNINFVTPTHYAPQLVESIALAVEKGLEIPLVYNCGGYESIDVIRLLENIFDIYMPDIKYGDNEIAKHYSGIENYCTETFAAVKEMHHQVGELKLNKRGIAQRGLIIRHLVLPDTVESSKRVIDYVAKEISLDSYINIMDQYRPAYKAGNYPNLNRRITEKEFSEVVMYAKESGLFRGLELL